MQPESGNTTAKTAYLYAIGRVGAPAGASIKIGWTKNLQQRLAQLQSETSDLLSILHHARLPADQVLSAEREAHKALVGTRATGEWFNVPLSLARAAIDLAVAASPEPRVPITMKLSRPVYERLREASFREKTDKQDLADRALDELLGKLGY